MINTKGINLKICKDCMNVDSSGGCGLGDSIKYNCINNSFYYYGKIVGIKEKEITKSRYEDIALEIARLVSKKNKDYGNSFDKTLDEYGYVAYILRIEDKISRLKSLTLKHKEAEIKDESVEDTLKDIIGYTLLLLNYRGEKC